VEVDGMYPEDNLYSKDHEWILVQDNVGTIGITDYAQHELGDVVYVDLPEVGDTFEANEPLSAARSSRSIRSWKKVRNCLTNLPTRKPGW
jgi:glycine cleavage system H protein